jgi:hypothetical protein
MTIGSVSYTAPEQLMGDDLGGRADQYALAAAAPARESSSAPKICRQTNGRATASCCA